MYLFFNTSSEKAPRHPKEQLDPWEIAWFMCSLFGGLNKQVNKHKAFSLSGLEESSPAKLWLL